MRIAVLTLLILVCGCGEDTLPKYVQLDKLRILAVEADQPEVNPGATVQITPFVSHINNSGALTFSWKACVDLGIAFGADPTCDGNPTATATTTGTITTLNAGNTFTGPADVFNVVVPASILTGRSVRDQTNGVAYLIVYTVSDTSQQSVTSVKRIIVSDPSKTAKNTNPSLTSVTANGATFTSLAAGSVSTLAAPLSGGSRETYSLMNEDGSFTSTTETIQLTWFYTDGETKFFRTLNNEANAYTAPASFPSGRASFVVIVARDERGGVNVLKAIVNP